MKLAMPWNNSSKPNAFVSLSSPSKSTRITDVSPTYAPIKKPNVAENNASVSKVKQKAEAAVA